MNAKTLIKENGESKKMLVKQWTRINGSGNNGDNNPDLSPVVCKTAQVGKKIPFSVGDIWTERAGKKVYFYKVIAIEDIIIPAGVYKCYKVIEELEEAAKNYYWFAPEVGLVKWEMGKIKGVLQGCMKDKDNEA